MADTTVSYFFYAYMIIPVLAMLCPLPIAMENLHWFSVFNTSQQNSKC